MTVFNLQVSIEHSNYLDSSSRLRQMSRKMLLERVLETVIQDQMILAILDDESSRVQPFRRTRVPRTELRPQTGVDLSPPSTIALESSFPEASAVGDRQMETQN